MQPKENRAEAHEHSASELQPITEAEAQTARRADFKGSAGRAADEIEPVKKILAVNRKIPALPDVIEKSGIETGVAGKHQRIGRGARPCSRQARVLPDHTETGP